MCGTCCGTMVLVVPNTHATGISSVGCAVRFDEYYVLKLPYFQHPPLVDELMRGLSSTPMETLDQFITGEVTNHLFEDRRIPFSGIDLIALNIQRGRDHGVPSYNNYRALCNLKRATTFEDLSREIPDEVIARYLYF